MGNTPPTGRATVRHVEDFDAEPATEKLREAMECMGTKEEAIVQVMANHSFAQRKEMEEIYKTKYGQDLVEDLKSELGGNFEDLVVAMMTPPRLFDAREINRAISGAGTDESMLIEILATRPNHQIEEIKEQYKAEYDAELEDDLMSDTSGYFGRLMVSLCNAGRDESDDVDYEKAREEANKIKEAGIDKWGTDETEINSVLCLRSIPQLRSTFRAYQELTEQDIKDAISNECSGSLADGYIAIIRAVEDLPSYFAWRINASLSGMGTEDKDLIRQIVSRSEIDLGEIKDRYQEQYERSLEEAIDSDCGGDYKSLLIGILTEYD